ncbi:heterokaryon incompatibility protein-domain-containing protein [Chaetomium strumarium]|uniref:Heterokaryon incompatibility protein-domain-containing protein n=1 Tax=Chaetomium strumarium TaxID=1170767 RepID=A0AAJ0GXX2_9PEZI|nr:heterokaryon incompatibility protein-domain-containing protein [Chaetomium strumarium]
MISALRKRLSWPWYGQGEKSTPDHQNQDSPHPHIPNERSIRILTLYPGAPSDPLSGRLETVSIDSGAGQYEAISYVWGDPSKTHNMVCNGADLAITESIYGALKRLRLRHAPRRLWADQICIDQDNAAEKNMQIPLMNLIYRNAGRVLVWLGYDEHGVAATAFDFVADLAATFADEERRAAFDRGHSDSLGRRPESKDVWAPLRTLTGLPWFTRAWVVQEIGTRAPATLFWGDAHIDWEVLFAVCHALTDYHHLRAHVDVQTPKIKYLYRRFIEPPPASRHANRFSFLYELHRARHLVATDPRDKVFAMLGHYSIRHSANKELRSLRPDYNQRVEDIYTDVATRALLGDDTSLLTLASVQHDSLPSGSNAATEPTTSSTSLDYSSSFSPNKLPSWVPDWRLYQSHILSEPTSPHRASGNLRAKLEVDDLLASKALLRIRGVMVDRVAACSAPFRPREFHIHGAEPSAAIESIWRDLCCQADNNGHDEEERESGENINSLVFAYLQTLSNACVAVAWQDGGQPYASVPKRQWLSHGAAYLVRASGRSCAVSEELKRLAECGDAAKWARSANGASRNRRFARTSGGYFVLGPKVMEPGDVVCVLYGGNMPFCLRPWGDKYLLVGECYVHGVMNGEVVEAESVNEQVFELV